MTGGIIYKVTNLVNGKIYIGKTLSRLGQRKNEHISGAKTTKYTSALHLAINKYGADGFTWEIVDKCLFSDQLGELEKYYIKKLNCKAPIGYNLTNGGEGVPGYKHSEETRRKMSESHKGKRVGEKNPMFGKHPSPETIEKIRISSAGERNGFYGKRHSLELRKKWSIERKGAGGALWGKKFTEEHKRKISMALMGRKTGNKNRGSDGRYISVKKK